MTTEEKARAYDEAIRRAKEQYDIYSNPVLLEYIFPELKEKESEDEKVRKELIEFVKSRGGFKQEYIAWLEKQGEKKPEENKGNIGEISPNWSEEDEHRIKDTIYFLDTAKKHYASTEELDACIDWLKSLKQRIGG